MKTVAALSLFSLVPAIGFTLAPARVHAQQQVALGNPYEGTNWYPQGVPAPSGIPPQPANPSDPDGGQPADPSQVPSQLVDPSQLPSQLPEPYRPPLDPNQPLDNNQTAAEPAQIDWPQDLAPEEAAVDSYDDGYDPQAYGEFQDELSPYGDWVDDASYGRVWVPEASLVGADFTPYYSGGHWMLTEYGWTWVSDWSWGWAPFHYGRWILTGTNGWGWVPGRIWGPAWVSWRSGGGWVGWAALPPRGVSVTATYGARSPWRFSRLADLGAPRPRCVPMRDMRGMFHRTTLVANDRVLTRGGTTVHINAGPRYVPNATPARLLAVAPQAFPQRRILPRPGATMAERPWIRAASARGGLPAAGGVGARGGAGLGAGRPLGHGAPARAAAPTPPPRIYNPPHTFASTVAPHAFGSAAPASTRPPGYGPPTAHGAPRAFGGAPVNDAPHVYNPPSPPSRSSPPSPPSPAMRAYGAPPSNNFARVYSPPPRAFAQPPAQRPPVQSFRPAYTPAYSAPPRNFGAPAPSFGGGGFGHAGGGGFGQAGGGGFGHAGGGGGGAHFGGGHRR